MVDVNYLIEMPVPNIRFKARYRYTGLPRLPLRFPLPRVHSSSMADSPPPPFPPDNLYSTNSGLGDPFRYSKYSGVDPSTTRPLPRKLTFLETRPIGHSPPDSSTSSISTSPVTSTFPSTPLSSPIDSTTSGVVFASVNSGGRPGISRHQRFKAAITTLHAGKLSPIDLMLHVLDPDNADTHRFERSLYCDNNKLHLLLDRIVDSRDGKTYIIEWLRKREFDVIGEVVSSEMDQVKKSLAMRVLDLTTEYIKNWTLETAVSMAVRRDAPVLRSILMKAAQTELAETKNKFKHPDTVSRSLGPFLRTQCSFSI